MKVVLTSEGKKIRDQLFPEVRNKDLLNLALINYYFFIEPSFPNAKRIIARIVEKKHFPNKAGIAFELQPSDIIPLIHCTEREAKQYIDLIRFLFLTS